jgi:tetratricopeptide (TPR) repeat protein
LGKREMAMEYLADLNNLSPASLEVIRLTGEMQEKDGNLVEAISSYEKAMRMDPKDLFIIRHLANIYIQEKLWDKAINHFKSALTNYPNEPFLLDGLGNLLINCPEPKLRNVEEGREYAERTFINFKSLFATKISAGVNLATAYAILGDKQKASKYINLSTKMAKKGNVFQNYSPYFKILRKKYNISN